MSPVKGSLSRMGIPAGWAKGSSQERFKHWDLVYTAHLMHEETVTQRS